MRRIMALVLIAGSLSACANTGLRQLSPSSRGPDEFLVEPKAELQQPADYASLPTPTPGQSNLTDNNPGADAVLALGGRPSNPNAAVPSSDGALVTAASRFGVTPGIRTELAQADAEFRRRQSRFTQYRIFPEDRYNRAYSRQTLDAEETARRWRQAGARTPSFPPYN
ncbi:DUF3035 domain-containing protein [Roseobacter sp.]|uniref:DUF3035 domain-containing protein n=1 Tax=Roseobacter sp. TaxID=1907202 RepID=UPI0025F9D363|nr:DUF3035 domain-containing protein [Roseobacter sp.]